MRGTLSCGRISSLQTPVLKTLTRPRSRSEAVVQQLNRHEVGTGARHVRRQLDRAPVEDTGEGDLFLAVVQRYRSERG